MSQSLSSPAIATAPVVSFDDEPLILVDSEDRVIGHMPKVEAHQGDGHLHRAFSVFLFDERGHVLMQQRSASKPLWPLIWSNSCCSHPRRGETVDQAAERRIQEELGLTCSIGEELRFLYKFQYHARYRDVGSEHELCAVYVGRCQGQVQTNPTEVADWHFIAPDELEQRVAAHPERYSPWFKLEWARLRESCWDEVREVAPGVAPLR
ncbi:MAG: isopentenyl-diphosphate Delta-isomerase [Acidobacteriota bacterium]